MRKALSFLMIAAAAAGLGGAKAQTAADPYVWLEDVSSPKALEWVEAHNAKSTAVLQADPRYQRFYSQALDILEAKDRIPVGNFIGGQIYNFWQDSDHVRGIWRRTTPESYATGKPEWETVLDLDALAASEKANWVWKGANCARPAERRCLINLSDGGEDAVTIREFDLPTKTFVKAGFVLPKGKQRVDWENENTLLVSREWKPGDLGRTGYPFIAKRLQRGKPLSSAVEVYRGSPKDGGYGVTPYVLRDSQNRTLSLVDRPLDTFRSRDLRARSERPAAAGHPGQGPADRHGRWARDHPLAGGMVRGRKAVPRGDPALGRPRSAEGRPGAPQADDDLSAGGREALQGASARQGHAARLDPRQCACADAGLPARAERQLDSRPTRAARQFHDRHRGHQPHRRSGAAHRHQLPDAAVALAGGRGDGPGQANLPQPPKFDASNLVAEQREATSSDGTKIPYFLVHRRDFKLDGNNPTLLYAYGGFEVSQTPTYSATNGKLWLENGGVYALANIRGGGEFGPAWHEAGLTTKRQIVYDDFAAVAKDLIATHVTSPRRLGIRGGSNGGLLMGVEFTQHPELWHAVVIDVPLLDMLRISKIAAGASWEGEYGSVDDDPAVRTFWEKTSPYQNLRADVAYPMPFIFTTTKDDRVGPQHARKFAARMEEMHLPFYYYENTEGGHAAGANLRQAAHTNALEMTYLTRKLMDPVEPAP